MMRLVCDEQVSFVSTGGGASLELLEGKVSLPPRPVPVTHKDMHSPRSPLTCADVLDMVTVHVLPGITALSDA